MEQLTFSQVKKGNLTFKSIGTPTGVQGQTPIFSLTKDGETVKYSTDGVNYEILGGGGALIFNNVAVAVADFVTDTTYADYPYRAAIALTGVALTMIANVVFDVTDATSGNFAPLSDTYAGGTYIYAKEVPAAAITIPTIYVLSETASGGISGNAWNNRGLWVANVQYNSYDIVYDNAGCYLCVADIASTTAPESDGEHWDTVYISPAVPELPTALPVTSGAKVSGSLPTSGWAEGDFVRYWEGVKTCDSPYNMSGSNNASYIGINKNLADKLYADATAKPIVDCKIGNGGTRKTYEFKYYGTIDVYSGSAKGTGRKYSERGYSYDVSIIILENGEIYGQGVNNYPTSLSAITVYGIGISTEIARIYTITDTNIHPNSLVSMSLSDEGGVKEYALAEGSITVIRDTVPTTPIPYEYKAIDTDKAGIFNVINSFVPTVPVKSISLNGTAQTPDSAGNVDLPVPTVDQAYSAASTNAQSGTAVAEALRDSVAPVDLPATSKYVTGTIEISDWEAIAGSNEYSYTIVTSDIIGLNYLKVLRLSYKGTIYIYSTADNGRITLHLAATPTAAITYTLQIVETSEQGTVILINTDRDIAGVYRRSIYSMIEAYRAQLTRTIDPRKTYIVKWAGASGVTDEKQFDYSTMVNISAATVNDYEGYQLTGAFFDVGNIGSPTTSYMSRVRCQYWYDTTVGASHPYLSARKEDYKFSDGSLSFVDLYIYDVIEIG